MKLRFTKMQGAGNDFVVLDATRAAIALTPEQTRRLGDRRFGVGADQILMVEKSSTPGIDFGYRIFNAGSGDEVEHCGNGARCFVRFVRDKGLSDKRTLRVQTMNNMLELRLQDDGRVTVDMNAPIFDLARVPFDATGLVPRQVGDFALWSVDVGDQQRRTRGAVDGQPARGADRRRRRHRAGRQHRPAVESHPRFARQVNAGFMQIVSRSADPPARVRARCRRDAGLRHRRLRGGGGRHPPRPARPARRGARRAAGA